MTNLNNGYADIRISGSRFTHVETGKMVTKKSDWGAGTWEIMVSDHIFRFYAKHMSYSVKPKGKDEWGFDVEEKNYLSSNHCTKISFYAAEGKEKETKKRITAFLDKMMAEAKMEPIPRFQLSKAQGAQKYIDLSG